MSARPVVLVCGGGTGGHVFPGLAIAERLRALADVEVVFVGTERGMETRLVPEAGYRLELLDVEPMKGGGPARLLRGALIAARATRAADALVARHAPRIVVSVGGYAAGPASLAAVRRRVPLVVVEPNAQLGLANRILAPFAERGYVAWSKTGRHFRSGRSRTFGVPLRRGFSPRPYVAGATPRLLVVGGSQGAAWLNEHVPSIVSDLRQRHPSLVVLIHIVCAGTLPGLADSSRPLADAAGQFLGPAGGLFMVVGAAVSIFGTMNGNMLVAPRLLYAMAEHGQLPRPLEAVHPVRHTPHVAIWVTAAVMLVLSLSGSFITAVAFSTLARLFTYGLTCAAVPVLRRRDPDTVAPFRLPGGSAIPLAALLAIGWVLTTVAAVQWRDLAIAVGIGLIAAAVRR